VDAVEETRTLKAGLFDQRPWRPPWCTSLFSGVHSRRDGLAVRSSRRHRIESHGLQGSRGSEPEQAPGGSGDWSWVRLARAWSLSRSLALFEVGHATSARTDRVSVRTPFAGKPPMLTRSATKTCRGRPGPVRASRSTARRASARIGRVLAAERRMLELSVNRRRRRRRVDRG
jgi:hypothetical protein